MQGDGAKTELLERFREAGNAVLLGSASFWEGVDVPGDALSVVVIDKLPFAPPDDPLLAARLEHLKREGGNPFFDWQVPQAAISLKQGAGRLIRDRDRPRRAGDLRPATAGQVVRQADLAQPAADAAHARTGRRRGVLRDGGRAGTGGRRRRGGTAGRSAPRLSARGARRRGPALHQTFHQGFGATPARNALFGYVACRMRRVSSASGASPSFS